MNKEAKDLCRKGKYVQAIELYEELLDRAELPDVKDIVNLGLCYLYTNEYVKTIEYCNLAIAIGFRDYRAFCAISHAYVNLNKYDIALKYARLAYLDNPESKDAIQLVDELTEAVNKGTKIKYSDDIIENSPIIRKKIINVINYKKGEGFEVYAYVYDETNNGEETFLRKVPCVNEDSEEFNVIKDDLMNEFNTDKFIVR